MIRETRIAQATIALALWSATIAALATGCAGPSGGGGQSNEDFEIRAMIAADRQQMQAMDERLRRIEGQIQDLAHNASAPATEGNAAPAKAETPSPAPAAETAPVGAPPAPGAPPGAPAEGGGMNPGGEAVPPGAAVAPAGPPPAEGAAATPAPGPSVSSTISRTPEEAGAAPPSGDEEGAAEAGSATGGSAEASPNEEGGSEGGAAETGNPEAQAPPGAAASGGAASEGAAAAGGEQVASAPPSSPPENAPAAIPPARWPDDLARETQSAASAKGGAGKLYRSGLDQMKNRNYGAAVESFAMIQKKFPHSDLTEPAAYFSASALNEMGKYDQAILQYNDLVMRYPNGKYAGEALLREAQDFVQINDKVDARLTLQKLVNEHSGTPEAATANAMMKSLESD
jgi:tol-pal system protein YbgF